MKKPHAVCEDLILPAAKAIIQGILCDEAARKVDIALFFDKTVGRDINEMAQDVSFQLLEEVRASWYLILSLNKNTDETDAAQLLVYTLCLNEDHFVELTMFWSPPPSRESIQNTFYKPIFAQKPFLYSCKK